MIDGFPAMVAVVDCARGTFDFWGHAMSYLLAKIPPSCIIQMHPSNLPITPVYAPARSSIAMSLEPHLEHGGRRLFIKVSQDKNMAGPPRCWRFRMKEFLSICTQEVCEALPR